MKTLLVDKAVLLLIVFILQSCAIFSSASELKDLDSNKSSNENNVNLNSLSDSAAIALSNRHSFPVMELPAVPKSFGTTKPEIKTELPSKSMLNEFSSDSVKPSQNDFTNEIYNSVNVKVDSDKFSKRPPAPIPSINGMDLSSVKDISLPKSLRTFVEICLKENITSSKFEIEEAWVIVNKKPKFKINGIIKFHVRNNQIIIKNTSGRRVAKFKNEIILSPVSGYVKIFNKRYRGSIKLSINSSGKLIVINFLSMEDYLKGVVPHEIGTLKDWAKEAIKAQAIAARTYAYKHLNSRRSRGFDMYADTRDQMYLGLDGEYELSNKSIEETANIVMQYNGVMINAYYHSTCGGKTATMKVWQKNDLPYLKEVLDFDANNQPWCKVSGYTTWEWAWTNKQLVEIANKYLSTANPSRIVKIKSIDDIKFTLLSPMGRIDELKLYTDKGVIIIKGDKTRWLLRSASNHSKILPSAWFVIKKTESGYVANGRGLGHGIGMCQMGARGRARAGQTFDTILKAYYTGVDLVRFRAQ